MTDTPLPTAATDYQDIEIVKGCGFKYRFASRFPAMKMLQFNNALVTCAKKVIYNAMLENGELGENRVGYQMISSKLARDWIFRDGFESPQMLEFLCKWIITPLDENAPPALDAILQADSDSDGSWEDEEITQKTPKTLSQLLRFIVERDLERKAGLNMLKLFFIKLITPITKMKENTAISTEPLPVAGTEEKTA